MLARKSELKSPSYFLAPATHTASFTVFGISSLPLLLLPNELIWGEVGTLGCPSSRTMLQSPLKASCWSRGGLVAPGCRPL